MIKQERMFGTDGVRNEVGHAPFTTQGLPRFGHALAEWAHARYGNHPRILIGHDTRVSCAWVKAALKSTLLLYPVELYDAGILPTPGVCALVEKTNKFDFGIIISASHNPYQDNGIKIITRSGKLSTEDEDAITNLFYENVPAAQTYEALGTETWYTTAFQDYLNMITTFFAKPFLTGKKIVLDCAHGATSAGAQQLFEQLGAQVIMTYNQPNGTNINNQCGALHPEQLAKRVLQEHAFAGCAFDGDGDRIVVVNQYGTILNGDALVALLSEHPAYQNQKTIVSTIMANQSLEAWLAKNNKILIRTAVGDKHVGAALKNNDLLVGGEPSGHVILRDFLSTGDGMFSALRILEAVLLTHNDDMTSFTPWPQTIINMRVQQKKDLTEKPYADIIELYRQKLPQGRLIIRYSGTENLLRVMVEDQDEQHACKVGNDLAQALQQHLL